MVDDSVTPGVYAHRSTLMPESQVVDQCQLIVRTLRGKGDGDLGDATSTALFEGIEVASPALARQIRDILESSEPPSPNHLNKVVQAIKQYAARAARRPTPFGIFAGVGLAGEDVSASYRDEVDVRFVDPTAQRPLSNTFLPDGWVIANHLADFSDTVDVTVSQTVLLPPGESPTRARTRKTVAIESAWTYCLNGSRSQDVIRFLENEYPNLAPKTHQFLSGLVRAHVLYCSPAPITISDITSAGATTVTRAQTRDIRPESGEGYWRRAGAAQAPSAALQRKITKVTKTLLSLSRSTTAEVAAAQYGNAFIARYGTNLSVPVLEACDPIQGIGYAPRQISNETGPTQQQEKLLQSLIFRARQSRTNRVEISDGEINLLCDPERKALTHDVDVIYRVGQDESSVDLSALWGTPLMAQSLGRFWQAMPMDIFEYSRTTTDPRGDAVTPIELRYLPHRLAHINVMNMPSITESHVCVDFPCGQPGELSLSELRFFHDGRKLRLYHTATKKPLAIRNLSMYNVDNATDLIYTIMTVGRELERDWVPFNWFDLSPRYESLPEVVYRGVTISKAAWRVPVQLCDDTIEDVRDWIAAFEQWRKQTRVPDVLEVGQGDRRLAINCTSASELELAKWLLTPQEPVVFRPAIATNETSREYVQRVHLSGRPRPSQGTGVSSIEVAPYSEAEPRLDWISLELINGSPQTPDPRMLSEIANLAVALGATDWHFLFYTSPDNHLRFRARLGTVEAQAQLFERLVASSRNVYWDIRQTVYRPEHQRYGGADNQAAIYRAFTTSSILALKCWNSFRGQPPIESMPICARTLSIVLDGLFAPNWREVFVSQYSSVRRPPIARKPSSTLEVEIAPPSILEIRIPGEEVDGGVLRSVVHMHSNRLFGTDPVNEQLLISTLRDQIRTDGMARRAP